jgi:hypothetical protein
MPDLAKGGERLLCKWGMEDHLGKAEQAYVGEIAYIHARF